MPANFSIFESGGGARLRSVKAPYHPRDLSLDRRFVTFDSAWLNTFRVKASGVVAGSALGGATLVYGLGLAFREVRVLGGASVAGANGPYRPTLAWQRNNGGSLTVFDGVGSTGTPLSYARGYGVCAVNLRDNEIYFSPSNPGHDYVYWVFEVNPTGWEASGAGGGRIGLHPLYGYGVHVARPGANFLTASLDDMMLTGQRNHFQIAQTGITGAATHSASGDPFPRHATTVLRDGFLVTLAESYPDYPPVIAYPTNRSTIASGVADRHSCSIFWLNPSQFMVLSSFGSSSPIRWAIVGSDAGYAGGAGALVRRIHYDPNDGLSVTKKDVDYYSAGRGDFIFRSVMQTPRFTGFGLIPTGAPTGVTPYDLPEPPSAGGPPFAFMIVSDNLPYSGWWCGCGLVLMQDIIRYTADPVLGPYYGPFFCGLVTNRTQYLWYRNPDYSVSYISHVATMNVSDFT